MLARLRRVPFAAQVLLALVLGVALGLVARDMGPLADGTPNRGREGESAHTGMERRRRGLALGVRDRWDLTRRRALDFGRMTTDS